MRWLAAACVAVSLATIDAPPGPRGTLVDIGGQRLHVDCTGRGSPAVVLENGLGDVSAIWELVQPRVSQFSRVCSYDRGGYAWSDPGAEPRTFAQLALELRTALERLNVDPPYVLVGQSYGGLVVRGFTAAYPDAVAAVLLVDAVHEDQAVVYGGQPHVLRDEAKGRRFPPPHIALNTAMRDLGARDPSQSFLDRARAAEADWSPEELVRFHDERERSRATLGDRPLIVLARTNGGYADGMRVPADVLERRRREQQADLARLSTKGRLVFAPHAGHNIHVDDPDLVVRSVRELVDAVRAARARR